MELLAQSFNHPLVIPVCSIGKEYNLCVLLQDNACFLEIHHLWKKPFGVLLRSHFHSDSAHIAFTGILVTLEASLQG